MEKKGSGWCGVGCHTCNPCTREGDRDGNGEGRRSTKTPFRLSLHCVATGTSLADRTQRDPNESFNQNYTQSKEPNDYIKK